MRYLVQVFTTANCFCTPSKLSLSFSGNCSILDISLYLLDGFLLLSIHWDVVWCPYYRVVLISWEWIRGVQLFLVLDYKRSTFNQTAPLLSVDLAAHTHTVAC